MTWIKANWRISLVWSLNSSRTSGSCGGFHLNTNAKLRISKKLWKNSQIPLRTNVNWQSKPTSMTCLTATAMNKKSVTVLSKVQSWFLMISKRYSQRPRTALDSNLKHTNLRKTTPMSTLSPKRFLNLIGKASTSARTICLHKWRISSVAAITSKKFASASHNSSSRTNLDSVESREMKSRRILMKSAETSTSSSKKSRIRKKQSWTHMLQTGTMTLTNSAWLSKTWRRNAVTLLTQHSWTKKV